MPQAYREQTADLWTRYGLFVHSGMDTILGKGKKDASTLMTYAVADRFLKEGGKLGFLITQSVWKTGAGQGFRRFRIGENGPHLGVLHVDDLSSLQVFEGASTRTSAFVLQKGRPTRYPVPYTYWKKTTKGKGLDYDSTLDEVMAQTKRLQFYAVPVDPDDPTSPGSRPAARPWTRCARCWARRSTGRTKEPTVEEPTASTGWKSCPSGRTGWWWCAM
ncbi:hypothetical protein [Rhodothermus marinus]|uniref:hypothetical protein n=1 Tax=Rhodothermus marinus TaxID=29549 RepID=UPI003F70C811